MIKENRDLSFWISVASDPVAEKALMGLTPEKFANLVTQKEVLPLASENGGFLFVRAGSTDLVKEFHVVYKKVGHGKEAYESAIEAASFIFKNGAKILLTYECRDNPSSRPPRSFGFKEAGDFNESYFGDAKVWTLNEKDFFSSPAYRRTLCRQQS